MLVRPDIEATIRRIAEEEGINPAYALAVAERESAGNPNARNSKTIHGLFQMTGGLRRQHGIGDSTDPEVQTRGYASYLRELKADMAGRLGRDPTDAETYLGHHFGPHRGALAASGRVNKLSPQDFFSPYELSINPHLARGRSIGDLASDITGDINRRVAKHGGPNQGIDLSQFGDPEGGLAGHSDLSQWGDPEPGATTNVAAKVNTRPGTEIDLSGIGPSQMQGTMPPAGTAQAPNQMQGLL